MPDVHANFFRFEAGQFVEHEGRKFKICALISVDSVLAEDAEDGTSQRLKIETLKPWSPQKLPTQAEASGKKDLSHFTEQEWAQAQKRLEAIKPLLALPVRIRGNVEQRARETGVNTATLYEWMKLFQASGHVSALVPERRGRKLGSRYLNQEQETLIQSVIEDKYLHKQRVKVQDVVDEVARRARLAKQQVPSANTVRSRVAEINPAEALKLRGRPDQARNLYDPIRGNFPGADFPLAVVC